MTSKSCDFIPKKNASFFCEKCDYITSNKKDFKKHVETNKHKTRSNTSLFVPKNPLTEKQFICDCGKKYKHRTSLNNHKYKCTVNTNGEYPITKELVVELIQQNKNLQLALNEQQNKVFELAKECKYVTNHTTNNQFNINFFLNEECKDALNLMEFIDSLNVEIRDLEYTANKGYVEGISNIFINALSCLNVYTRPIHCSDLKRDVLYIKDNGEWQKDDDERTKLTSAIKIVGNKNIKQICEWQKAYPDYTDPSSKQNDKYMKLLYNSMSGTTKEEVDKNHDKIIKNISKEVAINKKLII